MQKLLNFFSHKISRNLSIYFVPQERSPRMRANEFLFTGVQEFLPRERRSKTPSTNWKQLQRRDVQIRVRSYRLRL